MKTSSAPPQKNNLKRKQGRFIWLAFLFFGISGFYFLFIQPLRQSRVAKEWKPVSATIVSSEIEFDHGRSKTQRYHLKVSYRYILNERIYTSNRFSFVQPTYSRQQAEIKLKNFPIGQSIPIYINPINPAQSVIFREVGLSAYYGGIVSILFILLGLYLLFKKES